MGDQQGPIAPALPDLLTCCASAAWAGAVAAGGPYASLDALIEAARAAWWHQTPVSGWLEAFAAHPKIGDLEGLREKYAGAGAGGGFGALSAGEQAGAAGAPEAVLRDLAAWNARYEARFGHIFIICAAGRSAQEMLAAIQARYANPPAAELTNAAVEQQKITELRLRKLFGGGAAEALAAPAPDADRRAGRLLAQLAPAAAAAPPQQQQQQAPRSPITTHVLDTCLGRPAPGVGVTLARLAPGSADAWEQLAAGATNADGRCTDLLPPAAVRPLAPGRYRISWDVAGHQARCAAAHPAFFAAPGGGPGTRRFYPAVSVEFEVHPHQAGEHFHVPLTWNPFGYSTYRGS